MSGYPTSLVSALILSMKNIPGQPEKPEEVVEAANGQRDAGVGLGELNAGPEVLFGFPTPILSFFIFFHLYRTKRTFGLLVCFTVKSFLFCNT